MIWKHIGHTNDQISSVDTKMVIIESDITAVNNKTNNMTEHLTKLNKKINDLEQIIAELSNRIRNDLIFTNEFKDVNMVMESKINEYSKTIADLKSGIIIWLVLFTFLKKYMLINWLPRGRREGLLLNWIQKIGIVLMLILL